MNSLFLILALVFTARFAVADPAYVPNSTGGFYSSGGFRAALNPPTAALGTPLPSVDQKKIEYDARLKAQAASGTQLTMPDGSLEKKEVQVERQSRLAADDAEADAIVPKARPEVLNGTLGWDEKVADAIRILEIGQAGKVIEAANLAPIEDAIKADGLDVSAPLLAAQMRQYRMGVEFERTLQAAEYRGIRENYLEPGLRQMTRDYQNLEAKTYKSAFKEVPPPKGTDAPDNRTAGNPGFKKPEVDRILGGLTEATVNFLEAQGIDPRDYAAAWANGEMDTAEARAEFFESAASASGRALEDGAFENEELKKARKEFVDQYEEMTAGYEDGDDDVAGKNSKGKNSEGRANRKPEVAAYDDEAGESLDGDGVSQKEKRALLSFVQDWWNQTTGNGKQKLTKRQLMAQQRRAARALGKKGFGQKSSLTGSKPRPHRTIFDIAGDTYRRGQTS